MRNDDIYYKPITFSDINNMWNIVRKTCKNKKGIYEFSKNKNINIYTVGKILMKKSYIPFPYRLFMIFEPKARLVMSQDVFDKIVNHFTANHYLIPLLEKKLIDSNVATRKNKGSSYANKLVLKYINNLRMKYKNKEIYVLEIDISKYFYNINHEILINMLKRDINDENVINLIKIILDETNKSYINETIDKLNRKNNTDIPYYKKDVGLSIGAMTSQFLAIYYLSDLDHFIKEQLRCKYYIRYMDNLVIFDIDKSKLKDLWKIIDIKLNELKLRINPKSNIYKLSNGFSFLGYRYINEDKLIIRYRNKTINKINKKLRIYKEKDLVKYYKSYASYFGYLNKIRNCERKFKMKLEDKYNYYKEKYPNNIVFIKDKKFFNTYLDDAIIIWDIFNYKWHDNYISFGDSAKSKVFDYLKNKNIGYIIVGEDEIIVNGNKRVYELELELSKINYDKYEKMKIINEYIERLLDIDLNISDKIINYLESLNKEKIT